LEIDKANLVPVFKIQVEKLRSSGGYLKINRDLSMLKQKIAIAWDDERLTFGHHPTGFDQKIRQNSVIRSICRSKFAHGTLSGRSARIGATERRIELEWSQVLAVTADIWNSPARRGRTRCVRPGSLGRLARLWLLPARAGPARGSPNTGHVFPAITAIRAHYEWSTLA
jgi:hypothetical protein